MSRIVPCVMGWCGRVPCTRHHPHHPRAAAAATPLWRSRSPCSTQASATETPQGADPAAAGPASRFVVAAKDLAGKGRLRLDAYLALQLPDASRAKIAASIKAGCISVNGAPAAKPSLALKGGEVLVVRLLPPEPCTAVPESIPLDVVYEDAHVIVINKAPGMVVHLSPGHSTGTLVNALLGHCRLGPLEVASGSLPGGGLLGAAAAAAGGLYADDSDVDEDEDEAQALLQDDGPGTSSSAATPHCQAAPAADSSSSSSSSSSSGALPGVVRPGIVHRLDKGTSGLMVVAKDDLSHMRLCEQFKARTVSRIYNSVVAGVPSPAAGRVATNIVRDPSNRLRMTTAAYGSAKGRSAASNYSLLQVLAEGGAAVMEWRLETGRTHQIRVHAKHLGHALLGDDTYGPGHTAAARLVAGKRSSALPALRQLLEGFGRPALHAATLGFTHPVTGRRLQFASELPADFQRLVAGLGGGAG